MDDRGKQGSWRPQLGNDISASHPDFVYGEGQMHKGVNFDQNNVEPCKDTSRRNVERRCSLMGIGG